MKILLTLPIVALAACQTTTAPARIYYPVEKCDYVDTPVYGKLDRPASGGEIVGGAVIGGVIGNAITDDAGGTAIGAILGGAIANQRRLETVVVGTKKEYKCWNEYK